MARSFLYFSINFCCQPHVVFQVAFQKRGELFCLLSCMGKKMPSKFKLKVIDAVKIHVTKFMQRSQTSCSINGNI